MCSTADKEADTQRAADNGRAELQQLALDGACLATGQIQASTVDRLQKHARGRSKQHVTLTGLPFGSGGAAG